MQYLTFTLPFIIGKEFKEFCFLEFWKMFVRIHLSVVIVVITAIVATVIIKACTYHVLNIYLNLL